MRDVARIARVLALVGAYWRAHPDLRLAQLVGNFAVGCDPYYLEDDALELRLRRALRRYRALPYISQGRRDLIAVPEPHQGTERTLNAGELTYLVTVCLEQYRADHGDRYQTFAEIVGALECAKLEAYRRVIAPYESEKCATSGDVYGVL